MSGNTVVTAVTLARRGNRSKIAYFLHTARTARAQRTVCPLFINLTDAEGLEKLG